MFSKKRKYEKKLINNLLTEKEFLIERSRLEWNEIEKLIKKEARHKKLMDFTKTTVSILCKTILIFLLVGGVLTVAAIAPNVFVAYGRSSKQRRYFNKSKFKQSINYLKRQKYIQIKKKEGEENFTIELTKLGAQKVVHNIFNGLKIKEPEKWDYVWRMVIFDIPERHRWAREGIREHLKTMGFYRIQKSAFVFPYPCYEEIKFLASIYSVVPHIRFIEAVSLYESNDLKEYFNL